MRNVAIAVFVVFVFGAVVVAALSVFEITKDAAKPIAGSLVAAIPVVHQLLQQSGSRLSLSARKRGVVHRDGFTMPLLMLAFYGLLIVFAVAQVVSMLGGIAAAVAGVAEGQVIFFLALGIVPTMITTYLVGTWIGIRSESKGFVALLAIALAVPLIDRLMLLIFAGRQNLSTFLHTTTMSGLFFAPVAVNGLLIGVPGVLGYWRGRIAQPSRYLAYLLRALPDDSRDTLVNLAYEEARRLASNKESEPGSPRPDPALHPTAAL